MRIIADYEEAVGAKTSHIGIRECKREETKRNEMQTRNLGVTQVSSDARERKEQHVMGWKNDVAQSFY